MKRYFYRVGKFTKMALYDPFEYQTFWEGFAYVSLILFGNGFLYYWDPKLGVVYTASSLLDYIAFSAEEYGVGSTETT